MTAISSDSGAERVRELVFDALVIKDRQLSYVGHLASRIEVSNDGRTLIFHLRDDVKFHNGKQLQATDVEYSLNEMIKSRGFKSGAFFETVNGENRPLITEIKTTNERTLVVSISRPYVKNSVLSMLAYVPIIPLGTIDQIETAPVGSGPFKLRTADLKSGVVDLEANKDYWDGKPTISGVRLKTVRTPKSVISGLSDGSLDIVTDGYFNTGSFHDSVAKLATVRTWQFAVSNISYMGFNTRSKHLKDVRIRKAIALAIDRQRIVDQVLSGRGSVAHSLLPPQSLSYSEGIRYDVNLEAARRLLKEARYKGRRLSIKVGAGNETFSMLSKEIVIMLRSTGINVKIEMIDPGQLRAHLMTGEFEMNIGLWIGGNQEPLFFKDVFSTSRIPGNGVFSCCNRGRFSDRAVDRMLEEAISSVDLDTKRELYKKAWNLISEKVPVLPLYHPAIVVIANKRIGNINPSPTGDWRFIKDITVETN